MSISTRDIADRAGAVIGTVGGVILTGYLFSQEMESNLVFNGQSFNISKPVIAAPLFFLTIGVCSNLSRNAAVGIHDTTKHSAQLIKGACKAISSLFQKWCGHKQSREPQIEEMV